MCFFIVYLLKIITKIIKANTIIVSTTKQNKSKYISFKDKNLFTVKIVVSGTSAELYIDGEYVFTLHASANINKLYIGVVGCSASFYGNCVT